MQRIMIIITCLVPVFVFAQQVQPHGNYDQLQVDYHAGKLENNGLLYLSLAAADKKEDAVGKEVAISYKHKVIDKQSAEDLISPELKKFMAFYYMLFRVKDPLIRYMIKHPDVADRGYQESGFSTRVTDYIVTNEMILPVIQPGGYFTDTLPDWSRLKKAITQSTNDKNTAQRLVLQAKLSWHTAKEDWPNVIKYQIEKIETQGIDTAGLGRSMVNNMLYDVIFMHSDDTVTLNKGIRYIMMLLDHNPRADTWIDTYANLLYKTGRKQEAIVQEKNALSIARERKDSSRVQEYQMIINKMFNDQPTWK